MTEDDSSRFDTDINVLLFQNDKAHIFVNLSILCACYCSHSFVCYACLYCRLYRHVNSGISSDQIVNIPLLCVHIV